MAWVSGGRWGVSAGIVGGLAWGLSPTCCAVGGGACRTLTCLSDGGLGLASLRGVCAAVLGAMCRRRGSALCAALQRHRCDGGCTRVVVFGDLLQAGRRKHLYMSFEVVGASSLGSLPQPETLDGIKQTSEAEASSRLRLNMQVPAQRNFNSRDRLRTPFAFASVTWTCSHAGSVQCFTFPLHAAIHVVAQPP